MVTFTRDRTETKVTIADTAEGFNDVDEDPQFSTVPAANAPAFLAEQNGFTGTMNRRVNSDDEDGKVEEVVVVRTNIKAPRRQAVRDRWRKHGCISDYREFRHDQRCPTETLEALEITTSEHAALMVATMFSSGSGEGMVPFTGDDGDTDDMDEAAEFMGTFDGGTGHVQVYWWYWRMFSHAYGRQGDSDYQQLDIHPHHQRRH